MDTLVKSDRVLDVFDASDLFGLHVQIENAAIETIDENDASVVTIPYLKQASKAAAVARCLTAGRLNRRELKAIRRIAGLKLKQLALAMGIYDHAENFDGWESENFVISAYADKVFRLAICERLTADVPGIPYSVADILRVDVRYPWVIAWNYIVSPIRLVYQEVDRSKPDESFKVWRQAPL